MTPEQFCYWLQGHVELAEGPPTAAQWTKIADHLQLVFEKLTPQRPTLSEALREPSKLEQIAREPRTRESWLNNPALTPGLAAKITC